MLTTGDIVWGMLAPVVIALVSVVLAHVARRRQRGRDAQPWGPAVALAAAFGVAFDAMQGPPALPPLSVQGWLPYLGAGGVLVAVLATVTRSRRAVAWSLSIVLLLATAWLVVGRKRAAVEGNEFAVLLAVGAAALVGWWVATELVAERLRGPALPLWLAAAAGSAALVLADSGTQTMGQIAGALAVALAAVGVMAFRLRDLTLAGGGVLVTGVLLVGLLVCHETHYFGDVRTLDALALVAAAPVALWVLQLLPRKRPWLRYVVSGALLSGILSTAVVPAVRGLQHTMQEQLESTSY
jgi:hypothetical protein